MRYHARDSRLLDKLTEFLRLHPFSGKPFWRLDPDATAGAETARFLLHWNLNVAAAVLVARLSNDHWIALVILGSSGFALLLALTKWLWPNSQRQTALADNAAAAAFAVGCFFLFSKTRDSSNSRAGDMAPLAMYLIGFCFFLLPILKMIQQANLLLTWHKMLLIALALFGEFLLILLLAPVPAGWPSYLILFAPACILLLYFCDMVTHGYVQFMAVSPRQSRETQYEQLQLWLQVSNPTSLPTSAEGRDYRRNVSIFAAALLAGLVATVRLPLGPLAGLLVFLGVLAFWRTIVDSSQGRGEWKKAKVLWQALLTFTRYNPQYSFSAGLYQFPGIWSRPQVRQAGLVAALLLGAVAAQSLLTFPITGIKLTSPPPDDRLPQFQAERPAPSLPGEVQLSKGRHGPDSPEPQPDPPQLTIEESLFLEQLTGPDRQAFLRQHATSTDEVIPRRAESSALEYERAGRYPLWVHGVLIVLGPLALFLSVFWFLSGNLLLTLYERLEENESWNERSDPTDAELSEKEGRA